MVFITDTQYSIVVPAWAGVILGEVDLINDINCSPRVGGGDPEIVESEIGSIK